MQTFFTDEGFVSGLSMCTFLIKKNFCYTFIYVQELFYYL